MDVELDHGCLLVGSGGQLWAVPSDGIARVSKPPRQLAAIPGSPSGVLGVFEHEDETWTLVDATAIVGGRTALGTRESRMLLLHDGEDRVAVQVAWFEGVLPEGPAILPQDLGSDAEDEHGRVLGAVVHGREPIVVVDLVAGVHAFAEGVPPLERRHLPGPKRDAGTPRRAPEAIHWRDQRTRQRLQRARTQFRGDGR